MHSLLLLDTFFSLRWETCRRLSGPHWTAHIELFCYRKNRSVELAVFAAKSIHSLVSIMCERLSAMQDLGLVLRICAQNPKNTPPPPKMKTVQDFGFEVRLPRVPPSPANENLFARSWCVETNRCIPP